MTDPRKNAIWASKGTRDRIQIIKRERNLKSAEKVLEMLLAFYQSNWENKALLDKIIADIRSGGDGKDGGTDK
jgi:hypothetical protein